MKRANESQIYKVYAVFFPIIINIWIPVHKLKYVRNVTLFFYIWTLILFFVIIPPRDKNLSLDNVSFSEIIFKWRQGGGHRLK